MGDLPNDPPNDPPPRPATTLTPNCRTTRHRPDNHHHRHPFHRRPSHHSPRHRPANDPPNAPQPRPATTFNTDLQTTRHRPAIIIPTFHIPTASMTAAAPYLPHRCPCNRSPALDELCALSYNHTPGT